MFAGNYKKIFGVAFIFALFFVITVDAEISFSQSNPNELTAEQKQEIEDLRKEITRLSNEEIDNVDLFSSDRSTVDNSSKIQELNERISQIQDKTVTATIGGTGDNQSWVERLFVGEQESSTIPQEYRQVTNGGDTYYVRADGSTPNTKYYITQQSDGTYEVDSFIDPVVTNGTQRDLITKDELNQKLSQDVSGSEIDISCPTPGVTFRRLPESLMCLGAKVSYNLILTPAKLILEASGKAFNYTMDKTVLNMNNFIFPIPENRDASAVAEGWKIFRDISNILFIFVLLYAAINMIIRGVSSSAEMIKNVIIVAVLINFSFFITSVMIDISNTVAISFYEAIKVDNPGNEGLSEIFLAKTSIASIYQTPDKAIAENINYTGIIKQSIFGGIVMFVTAVVMFIMSFMLITRLIILIAVLMTSSIAFGAYILPNLRAEITSKWQSALIGQAMFAPVFLILFWVSVRVMNSFSQFIEKENLGDWSNVLSAAPGTIVGYIITVGLIVMSLKVAKSVSDKSGDASKKVSSFVGSTLIGGSSWIGRRTVGATAHALANNMAGNTALGRMVKGGLNRVGSSSLDVRSTKTFGNLAGSDTFGKASGKGGYKKISEDRIKKHEGTYKGLGGATTSESRDIAAFNEFKNINKEAYEKIGKKKDSIKKKEEQLKSAKLKGDNKLIGNITAALQTERTELQEQESAMNKLGGDKLEAASKAATQKGKDRQAKFLRQAGKKQSFLSIEQPYRFRGYTEFARQQAAKDAKEKKDTDAVVGGLKELKDAMKKSGESSK